MKRIATIITLLILSFANVHAQKILKPKWSTAHVGTAAHFNNSGTKLLTCGGYGIDVWDNKVDTLLYTFTYTEEIIDAKFCRNDSRIVAISNTGVFFIIDAANGKTIRMIEGDWPEFKTIEISKDGDKVIVLTKAELALIRSVESGNIISKIYAESEILGGKFSNNGSYVIFRLNNKAEVFDPQTGASIKVFPHSGLLSNAEFNNDDKMVLTVSVDSGMKIWDFVSDNILYTTQEKSTSLAEFSPNGKYFYYVSDLKIIVKSITTGEIVATFASENSSRGISSVHFNKSGEYIISTNFDGSAKLWNVKTGKLSHVFPMKSQHHAGDCEFDVSGRRFLTTSKYGIVSIWDTVAKTKVAEHIGYSGEKSYPEFNGSEKKLIVTSDDLSVKMWDTETGDLDFLDFLDFTDYQIPDIADNKILPYCSNNTLVTQSIHDSTRIWDMNTLGIIYESSIIASIPHFLPNCTNFIYRNLQTNGLEVFNLESKSVTLQLEDSKSHYFVLRISINGDFVTAIEGHLLHVWSLQSGKHLHSIELTSNQVEFIDFVDNKTLIIHTRWPRRVLQWIDVEQGTIIRETEMTNTMYSSQLSKNKSKIIIIDGNTNIQIWDAQSGAVLRTLEMVNTLFSLDFSYDETLMLTIESKGITVYNAETLEKIAQSEKHRHIKSAKFNHVADRIVTASYDGAIRVWHITDEKPIIPNDNIDEIELSPNPATDEITIKGISSASVITYTFTDLIGNTIHHGFIPEQTSTYTLSTQHLPSGFYNVTFQMNGTKHTEKLTVVH